MIANELKAGTPHDRLPAVILAKRRPDLIGREGHDPRYLAAMCELHAEVAQLLADHNEAARCRARLAAHEARKSKNGQQ